MSDEPAVEAPPTSPFSFDRDGHRFQLDVPTGWRAFEAPLAVAAWAGATLPTGFAPNLSVVHAPGASARGDALAIEVVEGLLDQLEGRRLIDVHLGADDDLRLVVTHEVGGHRLTLLQRILAHDVGSVTVSFTVPDLQVAATRDLWSTTLRSLTRTEVDA